MAKIKHTKITIKRKIEADEEKAWCEWWKILMPSIYSQFGRPCGQLKLTMWQAIDSNMSHLQLTILWRMPRTCGENWSIIAFFFYICDLCHIGYFGHFIGRASKP
jgi:hypothetical protein